MLLSSRIFIVKLLSFFFYLAHPACLPNGLYNLLLFIFLFFFIFDGLRMYLTKFKIFRIDRHLVQMIVLIFIFRSLKGCFMATNFGLKSAKLAYRLPSSHWHSKGMAEIAGVDIAGVDNGGAN